MTGPFFRLLGFARNESLLLPSEALPETGLFSPCKAMSGTGPSAPKALLMMGFCFALLGIAYDGPFLPPRHGPGRALSFSLQGFAPCDPFCQPRHYPDGPYISASKSLHETALSPFKALPGTDIFFRPPNLARDGPIFRPARHCRGGAFLPLIFCPRRALSFAIHDIDRNLPLHPPRLCRTRPFFSPPRHFPGVAIFRPQSIVRDWPYLPPRLCPGQALSFAIQSIARDRPFHPPMLCM